MRRLVALVMGLWAAVAAADVVHVTYQTSAGGAGTTLAETTLETGCAYTTVPAPAKAGFIFTHWSSSEADPLVVRDAFGRALDAARFTLYQDVTLTAHYRPASEDTDGDGVPDGWELYWYGDLAQTGASDTDGDGWTFAEELARGTNPLFPDTAASGGVARADSAAFLYNPHGYAPVIVRSEPEGALFAASTNYLAAGELWRSAALSVVDGFAYWTVDDVAQRDAFGRALDQVVVTPDASRLTEVVAHVVTDEATRWSLYWYGRADVSLDSDTDGDGYTFAEEIARGTNPLFPDTASAGGVAWADSAAFLYNPHGAAPVIVRSEPEGALFVAATNYVAVGDLLRTTAPAVADGFAYWTVDGVAQRDAFGRALDQIVVDADASRLTEVVAHAVADEAARWSLYWYGRADVSLDSDTDGDGWTFAEEIANGTNPLFPDTTAAGGVAWADSATVEANLQPFDPATGAVVGEAFEPLFTSPFAGNAATSRTFGPNARPVITDVNGDGVFDLVIIWDGGYEVYLNGGTAGNPTFTRAESVSTNGLDLAQGSLAALDGLTLDVPPTDAVSCAFGDVDQDGIVDLLVSDADGRIWFYKGMGENVFALQHKVWGGSHAGFASGLTIALVDWDGDGDLDCVCGTADGKLMLLVDPRVGRPTNVQATAGADSVVLTWDPNGNSRVRGYGVYRGADSNAYEQIEALWPLPRYRDVPEVVQDYWYRVTSLSRFYTAGNSLPTTSESLSTDAVYVQFRPRVWLTDTSGFTESNVTVVVSMNNSMGIFAEGLTLAFAYDPAVLEPRGMRTTGLTDGVRFEEKKLEAEGGGGAWRFVSLGGIVATGAGRFLLLDFRIRPVHDVTETTVALTAATVKALDGRAVALDLPQTAKIEISDSNPLVPALVAVRVADASVASETAFDLPVAVTSSEALTNFTAEVAWDAALLELRGVAGATLAGDGASGTASVRGTGGDFALNFYAKDPASSATNFAARVSLTNIVAVDAHGFVVGADDAAGTVLIRNAHPWVPATVTISTESRRVDTLETVTVPFAVASDVALASGRFVVEWDTAALELRGGAEETGAGRAEVDATGDFALTFRARDQHTISQTQVRLTSAEVTDAHGFAVRPAVPVVSTILIRDAHPLVPAEVALALGDVAVPTEAAFAMALAVSSTEVLTNLVLELLWDAAVLELRGAVGARLLPGAAAGTATLVSDDGADIALRFYAKENHTVGATEVTVRPLSGWDRNGLAAVLPGVAVGRVVLADSHPWVPATVRANVGGARVDTLTAFEVPVTFASSERLTNLVATVAWDADVLELRGVAGGAARVGEAADGTAQLAGDGGNFTLTFYAKDQHAVTRTDVRLSGVTVVDEHGFAVDVEDAQGVVLIRDSNPLVPAEVAVRVADASVASETAFELPVAVTSSETLTNFTAEVTWDAALLELRGVVGATLADGGASGTVSIRGTGGAFSLNFYAKDPASAATNFSARVSLTHIVAVDAHGFVVGADDAAGTVLIRNAHPWVPATVRANVGGARVDTLTAFEVPVTFASSERLTNLAATVAWDADVLELRGIAGGVARVGEAADGTAQLAGDGGNFTLTFYAKDQHAVTRTDVRLSGVTVVDEHGFAVDVEDAQGVVLIRDAHPLVPAEVALNVSPAASDTRHTFSVAIPVTSTKTLTNLAFTVGWDADVLELRGASGGAFVDGAAGNGSARIGARGTVPSTLSLTFYAKDQHTVKETAVTLGAASAVCLDGLAAKVTTVDGTVCLTDANPPVPVELTVATYHARVASGEAFKVPLGATASGDLAELTVDVDWDDTLLTFNGSAAATRVETLAANRRRLVFACEGNDSLFNLDFTAARIAGLQTNAWTRVVAASGVGRNGLAAVLKTALPRTGDVVIVREIGRYDPGDVDGDGAYTDRDQIILTGYIAYLKSQKKGANFAKMFAEGYLKQYGVDVRLTGAAARAADVNGDGQVNSSDIAMLEMLIAEAKGAGK